MSTEREKLFGNDLRIDERAGGLDFIADTERDLSLATGNINIIQALILRLKVRKGELTALGWPNYGSRLHELIGQPNNSRTHIILMAYARNTIEQDPRVEELVQVHTVVLPGERSVVRLIMNIKLIDEPSPLNLVFDMNLEEP